MVGRNYIPEREITARSRHEPDFLLTQRSGRTRGGVGFADFAGSAAPIGRAKNALALATTEFSRPGKQDHDRLQSGGLPDIEQFGIAFRAPHNPDITSTGNSSLFVEG
jgi:hypothetical protein